MANVPRVAILTPLPPSSRAGGVEVFTGQLAEALAGARIFAPSINSGGALSPLAHLGLEQPFQAAEPARALRKVWRREPYDVVISNGLCGWPLALAPVGSPMVEVYHITLAGFARKALRRRSDRFTTGRVAGFFDKLAGSGKRVVCVSESVRREVSALYGHPSSVLPNGVDVALFRRGNRDEAREELGLPRDARIALFVGRAEYAKGFDRIQELARAMKDVVFVSVSASTPGPENLRFFPGVPHDRMPLFYTAADVFVLPSRYEGFNLSVLEALACGVPVVSTAAAYPFDPESRPLATVVDPVTTDRVAQAAREAMERGPRSDIRDDIAREYSMVSFRRRWVELVQRLAAE
jgi:glycosyltransferase involved in cell wall biosynthesis